MCAALRRLGAQQERDEHPHQERPRRLCRLHRLLPLRVRQENPTSPSLDLVIFFGKKFFGNVFGKSFWKNAPKPSHERLD